MIGTTLYAQLPTCIDMAGHRFVLPVGAVYAVCERCGYVRRT